MHRYTGLVTQWVIVVGFVPLAEWYGPSQEPSPLVTKARRGHVLMQHQVSYFHGGIVVLGVQVHLVGSLLTDLRLQYFNLDLQSYKRMGVLVLR